MATATDDWDGWNPNDSAKDVKKEKIQTKSEDNKTNGEQKSQEDKLSDEVSKIGLDNKATATATSEDEKEEQVSQADISLMKKILRTGLIKSTNEIEITRNDPKSPLYSIKSFEELHIPEELLRGLYDMGFQAPSKIQETALPLLLANPPTNLIAQSQSGTGKTAAFLLASLCRMDPKENYPQVLILSPTFELALQTAEVAQQMAKYQPLIKFRLAVRGVINPGPLTEQVIIGTPGKVQDWSLRYKCFDISKIKVFVLDEADVMIDTQGHRNQSLKIHRALNPKCQMMLFSATYDEPVLEFAEMIITNPIIMRLKREEESLDNINQYFVECSNEAAKYQALANIFGAISIGQAFIFCHTKKSALYLSEKLIKDGHSVGLISGDLTVEQRTEVLKRFRDGVERVLISTNLMARGIDVDQVTVVVNYDLPINVVTRDIDFETYLHRIGRTGRFGKLGLAINLVDGSKTLSMIKKLEIHFGKKILKLDTSDFDELQKISSD